MKNCDRGLENVARGRRPRAAFSRPRLFIKAPFIQNSNQVSPRLTAITSFPRVFFHPCNLQGHVQAFRLTELLR